MIEKHIGNLEAYPVLANWNFFNHAGVSPLPRVTAEAMNGSTSMKPMSGRVSSRRLGGTIMDKLRSLGPRRLIGATSRPKLRSIKNTGEGISLVARGLDWQAGDRIVTTAVEYPTNIYPWMDVQKYHGTELILVAEETDADGRRAVPIEAILRAADHPKTRLIALSHVEYASGQRHDLATIGASFVDRAAFCCASMRFNPSASCRWTWRR